LGASYRIFISNSGLLKYIDLNASWQGAGKIYWNEANTLHQNFYSLLNASVAFDLGERVNIELWGRNLLNADYYTFYFKSMTNNFYNYGKPCRIGATVSFAL
jgi:outer membrane receptor protein involved in Fe transport